MLNLVFIVITILSLVLFYFGTGKDRGVLLFSTLWLIIIGSLAYIGYFENTTAKPPRFLLVIIVAIGLSVALYKLASRNIIDVRYLVAVHMLRLPVELVLYHLFLLKLVPVIMTFEGWNFDIIMGISAVFILAYMLLTKKTLSKNFSLLWNLAGLLFLTTIVVIAILSSPLPVQQLAFDQPNIAVLKFPFVYLPAYVVPVVYLSHILSLKKTL